MIPSVENARGADDPPPFRPVAGSLDAGIAVLSVGDSTVGPSEGGRF